MILEFFKFDMSYSEGLLLSTKSVHSLPRTLSGANPSQSLRSLHPIYKLNDTSTRGLPCTDFVLSSNPSL